MPDDTDAAVAYAQQFIRDSKPTIRPQYQLDYEAAAPLEDEAALAFVDDQAYRDRLRHESGEVTVWEGIAISECDDPWVHAAIVAHVARKRSQDAVAALYALESSWEVRTGFWLYKTRLRAVRRVKVWLAWIGLVDQP